MAEATLPASMVDAVEAHLAAHAAALHGPEAGEQGATPERSGRSTASAVLEVLRASGWIDTQEAERLRQEAARLRELLDLMIRDHRTREAVAAVDETRQRNWLFPL